ncbi:MAG: cation acetate symporter [Hyphomonas sp.]|uniref:sodium:solute symporter family protein n=1 Tax=Hyphomonas sp. TaxID=87 RepID=UPI00182DA34B|nr:sodium:solute symporter family protein [Hyphomonas sp.]MBA3069079.1 cation acetate symporter [Hyphomonas sp.]MBU3919058.1 cation acetate symporter [Alphaproteobacteria bacterium]MBU4061713.1 cation acetate symporter [Alphaproteobacteria bacterium]MBU4163558.1 cation acetate symporter [Alphaproteobacteria bacterium]
MDETFWTYFFVLGTFAVYIGIALWARANSTDDFYVAGHDVHPVINGMATAADWMSAASFLSMAGLLAFLGYGGSVYLMGWTGGYVLLALLLAPFLREFGKFTVPDFVGDRYYSSFARIVAVICALFVSFTYIAGQMKGVGVAFSGFLGVDFNVGILIGMGIVFVYATFGGMKGVTYTQVAQYVVLIFAYTVPAIFLSLIITGNPVPQLGFISNATGTDVPMIQKLNQVVTDLGFAEYTSTNKSMLDIFAITGALMFGTAGLPHVIIRFFTVSSAKNARVSAGWALVFIALLYTTAPAVGAFARLNFIDTVNDATYIADQEDYAARSAEIAAAGGKPVPTWYKEWEKTGLLGFDDKNSDGIMQYRGPNAPDGIANELTPNNDIFVLANPQIANLPGWVIGLVVAGGLAAALSTAAGLLMVISSAVSHDLCRRTLFKNMTDKTELRVARGAAAAAVIASGLLGIFSAQLGFVAQVVAFAFGLAAASLFPIIFLGIFWKRMNKEGAIASMLFGLITTFSYIYYFKFIDLDPAHWFLGVSPEGIGFVFMWISALIGIAVSLVTAPPPQDIQDLVEDIRVPGTRTPHGIADAGMAPMPAE